MSYQEPYQQPYQVPVQAPYQDPHHMSSSPPLPAHGPIDQREAQEAGPPGGGGPLQTMHHTGSALADEDVSEWHASYCGFCSPAGLCFKTCCCPCLTFGKTHHRLKSGANMQNYERCNTSCLLYCGAGCFGVHWIPIMMQRSEVRDKYNLDGNSVEDLCSACCCPLCDLVQQEKEAAYRESLGRGRIQPVTQQYQSEGVMAQPQPAYSPPMQQK
ncbi:hypothetical protein M406DRAFT_320048 [Cryphonectria parasitica EP155]|uniref:PLAC8-domain-containing protein n=1 Tax=Cryphonectria parasitica (strain ATCC 38755 / EP155) TaxID=660469 RepID=A0A9P5CTJ7_CRYP1|nr:uncharacterized protein M406DRAFT_320048 [Cryphonectria parasitica EP155]KAF3769742.1 hypothetical protein M406DRAFT_320048 [Cryphonectria parasitica EP155]